MDPIKDAAIPCHLHLYHQHNLHYHSHHHHIRHEQRHGMAPSGCRLRQLLPDMEAAVNIFNNQLRAADEDVLRLQG